MEKMKEIEGFPDYFITIKGEVYSAKKGNIRKILPWVDTKGRYLMVGLISQDGYRRRLLVHRLVGQAFIPNPLNLPEINHKDRNTQNNNADNLEWVSRKENLQESYKTMSPTRNFKNCAVYVNKEKVKDFQSIAEACRWAAKEYDVSYNSLSRYRQCGNVFILKNGEISDFIETYTRNRKPIIVYYKKEKIGVFKNKDLVFKFLKENYVNEFPPASMANTAIPSKYKNFEFVRQKCND